MAEIYNQDHVTGCVLLEVTLLTYELSPSMSMTSGVALLTSDGTVASEVDLLTSKQSSGKCMVSEVPIWTSGLRMMLEDPEHKWAEPCLHVATQLKIFRGV